MAGRSVAVARGSRSPPGVREPLRGSGGLLVRALLCFGCARLHSGLLRLGLLRGHVTLRGGLVLLGLAFLLQRLVPAHGPGRFLGPALHVLHDAFDACLRSRFVRQDRLPSLPRTWISFGAATRRSRAQTQRVPAFELDHLTAASSGGAFGATREDGRATSRLRPSGGPRGSLAERLWGFC